MFKHYLTTALRNLARHKVTTTFNLLGLCFGLVAFAIAYGIARYSSHGDLYHEKAARTYVLMQKTEVASAQWSGGNAPTSAIALGPLIKSNFPGLELVARLSLPREFTAATSATQLFADGSYADPEVLDVFDFDFIVGDRRTALRAPNSIVVRDELAQRLWGRTDVLGETLRLNNQLVLTVTGVMRAPREPSHLVKTQVPGGVGFSMLINMGVRDTLIDTSVVASDADFSAASVFTYMVLPNGSTAYLDELRQGLKTLGAKHLDPRFGKPLFDVRPMAEIRQAFIESRIGVDRIGLTYPMTMIIMGALILLVACINYANLTAAHASTRTKELAMRRVVGASRGQITLQSFFEASLLTLVASLLALIALPVVSLALKNSLGMDIRPVLLASTQFGFVWFATIVCTALVACAYPALVIAGIRPAQALQGSRATRTNRPVLRFLVIAQFVIAGFLLITSSLMRSQNNVLSQLAAKLQTDPVVVIDTRHAQHLTPDLLKSELRKQAAIKSVAGISDAPGKVTGPVYKLVMTTADPSSHHWLAFRPVVDQEYFATMDIPLLAGRNFSKDTRSDYGAEGWYGNMIIDRALAAQYGWTNPQDAIGKPIYLPTSAAFGAPGGPVTVVGVVENRTVYPLSLLGSNSYAYSQDDTYSWFVLVRLPKQGLEQGLQAIDGVWSRLAPGVPMKRSFLDERFEQTYQEVTAMSAGSSYVGILTMVVAIMGLMGMATHAVAQRIYEIGVRRTLGASTRQVLLMLLKDFSKPVIVANFVAWPLAFVAALIYSRQFTERVPISLTPFVVSLLAGIAVAWLAVIRQATTAARMNPATVLRHE